jgi:hypothetical protein
MALTPVTSPLFEGWHTGGFLITVGRGNISFDRMQLAAGQALPAGSLLGQITTSGLVTVLNPTATDGSETAIGILYADTDASAANTYCAVVTRQAEVNASEIQYGTLTAPQIAAAKTQLAVPQVIFR